MSFQDFAQSARRSSQIGRIKPQVVVGIAVIVVVLAVVLVGQAVGIAQGGDFVVAEAPEAVSKAVDGGGLAPAQPTLVCVHVTGCVNAPGVCSLEEGARVSDAIAAAGGLSADASDAGINLARVVQDGEQIIVPSVEDVARAATSSDLTSADPSASAMGVGAANDKVNLNTADASQLQTLSGVGESKAAKIIAYREQNGPFKSVDDLLNVSGIGEKTLEALRESICV